MEPLYDDLRSILQGLQMRFGPRGFGRLSTLKVLQHDQCFLVGEAPSFEHNRILVPNPNMFIPKTPNLYIDVYTYIAYLYTMVPRPQDYVP